MYLLYLECEFFDKNFFHPELFTSLQACKDRVEELKETLPKLINEFVEKEMLTSATTRIKDNAIISGVLLDNSRELREIEFKINYVEIIKDMPYDVDLYNFL